MGLLECDLSDLARMGILPPHLTGGFNSYNSFRFLAGAYGKVWDNFEWVVD